MAFTATLLLTVYLLSAGINAAKMQYDSSYYRQRIEKTTQLIALACPDSFISVEPEQKLLELKVNELRLNYISLIQRLKSCSPLFSNYRNVSAVLSLIESDLLATHSSPHSATNTDKRSTGFPRECIHATNITDYWRKDNNGNHIKPGGPHSYSGYACDYHMDIHWFRFTGLAGSQLLTSCPQPYSCGTYIAIWSDEAMPTVVGTAQLVTAYQAYPQADCKQDTNRILVMRCSQASGDFIYKNEVSYSDPCSYAFCGM